MKKIFLLLLLVPFGLPLIAANPSYIISYKNGANTVSTVKYGDHITITASFSEKMNNTFIPKIALAQLNGNPSTISPVNMTLVDSVTYIYNWNVGIGDGNLIPNVTIARNMANELVTNVGSTQTTIKVDNTLPVLSSSTIGVDVRYYGDLKVTDSLIFNFSEGLKTFGNHVIGDIKLRLGGKQGSVVSYIANLSNNNKQITVKPSSAMECYNGTNLYYIGFPDSVFSDSVGNVLALKEIVFHPDSVDVQPIVTGTTTGTDGLKFCPEDLISCSNPDANLQYQWMFNGNAINGATALQFSLPIENNGNYTLRVTNPITTCVNISNAQPITIYPTAYPTFVEKNENEIINVLVVDNSDDLFVAYNWKKANGNSVDAGLVDNRQFLTLSNASMNGDYIVTTTDIFGCTLTSASKNISVKTSFSALPNINNGCFKVIADDEELGSMNVKVFSQNGESILNREVVKTLPVEAFDINIGNVNSGLYFVVVELNNVKEVMRIVVNK